MSQNCGAMRVSREKATYLNSKARFKFSLRYIKRNEASLRKESLASKLADGDSKGFWKQIKGDSNVRVPLPTSVEGVTGEANIANLWKTHYKINMFLVTLLRPTICFFYISIL